jgi:hypothetical protein
MIDGGSIYISTNRVRSFASRGGIGSITRADAKEENLHCSSREKEREREERERVCKPLTQGARWQIGRKCSLLLPHHSPTATVLAVLASLVVAQCAGSSDQIAFSLSLSLSLCVCGFVVAWLRSCGCVAVWLCGCVAVWLCGCVVVCHEPSQRVRGGGDVCRELPPPLCRHRKTTIVGEHKRRQYMRIHHHSTLHNTSTTTLMHT